MGRIGKFAEVEEKLDFIKELAKCGYTNERICGVLGINPDTFYNYLKKHSTFAESIKNAKDEADAEVIKSLYKRCLGYDYVEEHLIYEPASKEGESVKIKEVKKVKKHIPADPFSATIWLNNRQPGDWKRSREKETGLNDEEINNLKLIAAKTATENL